jgi:uncharacterized protein YbjT (DUF2867 family)
MESKVQRTNDPKILVTGASGSNGIEIVKQLSAKGVAVRGMVRKPLDHGKGDLSHVEYVIANFDEPETIRQALEGIDRAFLVTNSSERVEEQQLRFVGAAREAGVRHIVYLSQLHATKQSPEMFLRYRAAVEEAIASSGLSFTHLRPNLFMQGLLGFRGSIAAEGRFYAPADDARVSLVDVRDIAAVAVAALTEDGHQGKLYDLTGPEALTHSELAAQLSQALGKQISFINIPEAMMRQTLLRLSFPAWQAEGLIEDYAHYRRGEASGISTVIQEVTKVAPHRFLDFARDYKSVFLH